MNIKISRLIYLLSCLVFLLVPITKIYAQSSPIENDNRLMINEIKLGGGSEIEVDGKKTKEYITIYNPTKNTINLEGWSIEYAKQDFLSLNCESLDWSTLNSGYKLILSGEILANTLSNPIVYSLNDKGSGSLRIVDNNGTIKDLVGWKDSVMPPCFENNPTKKPADGKSIVRYADCTGNLIDTDNNDEDFIKDSTPSATALLGKAKQNCTGSEEEDDDIPINEPGKGGGQDIKEPSCEGVILSEVLPNPAGVDSGNEFIELYNPTNKSVNLEGCYIELSSNNKKYVFTNEILDAGKYLALSDSLSGLSLPNSSGATVWLVTKEGVEISELVYPASLEDNQAWAYKSGKWQKTYKPTPSSENIILSQLPCNNGQVRNPLTNRCTKAILASSVLLPCEKGKVRNPLTNRCKKVDVAVSSLKNCDSDQVRNPLTNRCKKITSSSTLKPCAPGQERNPETNRCRKVLGATSSLKEGFNKVKDIPAENISRSVGWWLVGVSIFGVIGYGLFEWRKEFSNAISLAKLKITGGK